MRVVQCWDDGVTSDRRLAGILRKHKAKASFNINAGLHSRDTKYHWTYLGHDVCLIGMNEIVEIYEGFTIANHSLTHPHLETLDSNLIRYEIVENQKRLQDIFDQPVSGFAYPYGTYSDAVMRAVAASGHLYARTVEAPETDFPPENAMAFHPTCHFLAADFWELYERAKPNGVFYFWGHSYELINEAMWSDFEAKIIRISQDEGAEWANLPDLF